MFLKIENVSFIKENKTILKNINLEIDLNKLVVITGPNGSGKSTLMKLIAGIEIPTEGKIYYNGKDITNMDMTKRALLGIGYAFQQPIKFKGLNVYDVLNIASGNQNDENKIKNILNKVGLNPEEYINRSLDTTLSGGEHKRIEIASVLLRDNMLTIFDEPEAGIDLWSFNELIDLFNSFKNNNSTTIIISHQQKILEIAEEVILIKNGKINKVGTYNEVIKGE